MTTLTLCQHSFPMQAWPPVVFQDRVSCSRVEPESRTAQSQPTPDASLASKHQHSLKLLKQLPGSRGLLSPTQLFHREPSAISLTVPSRLGLLSCLTALQLPIASIQRGTNLSHLAPQTKLAVLRLPRAPPTQAPALYKSLYRGPSVGGNGGRRGNLVSQTCGVREHK